MNGVFVTIIIIEFSAPKTANKKNTSLGGNDDTIVNHNNNRIC